LNLQSIHTATHGSNKNGFGITVSVWYTRTNTSSNNVLYQAIMHLYPIWNILYQTGYKCRFFIWL